MADTDEQQQFPIMQRDYPAGTLVDEQHLYVMQYKDEDGRWIPFLSDTEDRDAMTRIQAYRLLDTDHAGEKRRVMHRVIQVWVDEVEGEGEGETSAEALLARNKANTERRLKEEEDGA